MKIALFGATGRVGQHILRLALADGHHVKALVRRPLPIEHTHLTIIHGDVLNKDDVQRTIEETDVVISALNTDKATVLSDTMPYLINSMKKESVTRIVTIGTAGILQARTAPHLYRFQSSESKRKTTRAAEEHLNAYQLLEQSSLDWTVVCPTYLPDGDITTIYRVEKNMLPEDGVKISTGDTAHFAYQQLFSDEFIRCRVGISY
ncbi:NAD(P)-dependent oxidoreductase [Metabacillus iocasae]|uniref:NADH-flavin reductase n=1 Tax=Priestia iocasae TaxID=2291674 RepID=A0ABS2QTC3_9BACI|nr:SDR family oxidoreductase [Metabacillus iocasae]MBM7702711.1 putative NADH-flavin reductase [Metabacillus iocasae]